MKVLNEVAIIGKEGNNHPSENTHSLQSESKSSQTNSKTIHLENVYDIDQKGSIQELQSNQEIVTTNIKTDTNENKVVGKEYKIKEVVKVKEEKKGKEEEKEEEKEEISNSKQNLISPLL